MACNLYFFMLYWILHQALSQRGGSNTKLGDNGTFKSSKPLIHYSLIEAPT